MPAGGLFGRPAGFLIPGAGGRVNAAERFFWLKTR